MMEYLPSVESPDDVPDVGVREAQVPIEMDEGFPTVGGIPFWERLDGEPLPYYKLFKEYRELKDVQGTRSVAKMAEQSGMSGRQITTLAHIYHWALRVKAYDQHKAYLRQVARQNEIEKLENKHAKLSGELLDQAAAYLMEHPEQMSPKTAIELIDWAVKTGRLSVGLNPDKPGSGSGNSGGTVHATNITIANQQTSNNADNINQLNAGNGNMSAVEMQTQEKSKDVTHLQSILHVLKESGAFAAAAQTQNQGGAGPSEEDDGLVEAEYSTE
jgi:hypothetical protein